MPEIVKGFPQEIFLMAGSPNLQADTGNDIMDLEKFASGRD
jgi:hypothetical protein